MRKIAPMSAVMEILSHRVWIVNNALTKGSLTLLWGSVVDTVLFKPGHLKDLDK